MCEKAFVDIAPAAARTSAKFHSQWGSLFEYMDMSLPSSMVMPACAIPLKIAKGQCFVLCGSAHYDNKGKKLVASVPKNNRKHYKMPRTVTSLYFTCMKIGMCTSMLSRGYRRENHCAGQ
eukprot:TRINITY_DN9155_c0_g1_i1.p2 TRINITY_DN9155_c0_g1~~TRINITY_DN9155_c0_g1_i1.p2  ORF type:complete len:120 (+),score=3.09 TRINITY_DN9155_c0_g1_i1:142-501(+)